MLRELAAAVVAAIALLAVRARRSRRAQRDADLAAALAETRPTRTAATLVVPAPAPRWVAIPGARVNGHAIVYLLTRELRDATCEDCASGVCVQRVLRSDAWPLDRIVHGVQRQLS